MSVRIDASAAAQAIALAGYNNSRPRAAPQSASASNTADVAPEREAALKRQLEDRLSTDIARIRQRVDTRDAAPSPSESTGRILDIRA